MIRPVEMLDAPPNGRPRALPRPGGRALLAIAAWAMLAGASFQAAAAQSVFLEELTWTEVRDAVHSGKTTILIPAGGTEQNGPHMALGKHNVRVRILAGKIAASLGNALVAPAIAYVPEGAISPPAAHMKFAGTISIPDAAFSGLIEGAARSFRQHGFTDIVLIGDHGGYQAKLKTTAARLNQEWAKSGTRAHYIEEYYSASQGSFVQALKAKGLSEAQIGRHAGASDTSLMMATDSTMVRPGRLAEAAQGGPGAGVEGDPRAASAALGQLGVDLIVERTVAAIRRAQESHH